MSEAESPAVAEGKGVEPAASWGRGASKAAIVLAVLLAALAVVYLTPLRTALSDVQEISLRLQAMGWSAAVPFTGGVAVLAAIGCPRLLLCPIGGMAFGFWWGLVWTQVGTMIGFYAMFLFVRWGGSEFAAKRWPKLDSLAHRVGRGGVLTVLLVRQMPVAGFYLNVLLGLMPLRHRHFLAGTFLGILPEAIPLTLLGAGASEGSFGKVVAYVVTAVVCFAAGGLGLRRLLKRSSLTEARTELDGAMENRTDGEAERQG